MSNPTPDTDNKIIMTVCPTCGVGGIKTPDCPDPYHTPDTEGKQHKCNICHDTGKYTVHITSTLDPVGYNQEQPCNHARTMGYSQPVFPAAQPANLADGGELDRILENLYDERTENITRVQKGKDTEYEAAVNNVEAGERAIEAIEAYIARHDQALKSQLLAAVQPGETRLEQSVGDYEAGFDHGYDDHLNQTIQAINTVYRGVE